MNSRRSKKKKKKRNTIHKIIIIQRRLTFSQPHQPLSLFYIILHLTYGARCCIIPINKLCSIVFIGLALHSVRAVHIIIMNKEMKAKISYSRNTKMNYYHPMNVKRKIKRRIRKENHRIFGFSEFPLFCVLQFQ